MKVSRLSFPAIVAAAALAAGCSNTPTKPVVTVPLDSLLVIPSTDTLFVGDTRTFTALAIDTGGVVVPNPALTWTSGNAYVFTVSRSGTVTGMHEGSAWLIVSSGGLRDTAVVSVLTADTGWFKQTSNTSLDLNGVFFMPDGNSGWAVGANGRILATTTAGRTWTVQTSNTSFALHGVWFTEPGEGWVVGAGGTVLHTKNAGQTWSRVGSGTNQTLYDVTFATRDTGWAVGTGGTILRTFDRGDSWQSVFPTSYALRGVSFAGTRDGWAVGDGGVIVGTHDRGVSWDVMPSVTIEPLRAVWRRSTTAAWAVGSQGVAPRTIVVPPSVVWQYVNAGPLNQLEGVSVPADSTGFAVGYNGAGIVLRTDDGGRSWTTQAAGTPYRLNDVFFIDPLRGWAVGNTGVILHTVNGGLIP